VQLLDVVLALVDEKKLGGNLHVPSRLAHGPLVVLERKKKEREEMK
jgi:hypothetical protein